MWRVVRERAAVKSPVRYVVNWVMWCRAGEPLVYKAFRIFHTT